MTLTEFPIEEVAPNWFSILDYTSFFSPDIAPGEPAAER